MSLREDISGLSVLKRGQSGTGILIEYDAGFINPNDDKNKSFISELAKLDVGKSIITEPLYVYAVLQKYGVLNRNLRIYPEHILRSQDKEYQILIRERRAIGEANHPESSVIDLDRISHNILETWWDGHTLMGRIEILMSPGFINHGIISTKGDEVANLLRHRIMIGVSSRGVGSLKAMPNGHQLVQDDFEMICWDVVTAPSTPGSWIVGQKEDLGRFTENELRTGSMLNENLDRFLLS